MKICFLDTETAPALVYTYRYWKANISPDQVKHPSFFMSYQYAWGDGAVKVGSLRHIKHVLTDKDDKHLTKELSDIVSQADIVIAHNADRFDLSFLRARIAAHNLKPFNPPQVIDTLKASRRAFRLESHSLASLGKYLAVGEKLHSGGFENAIACMHGDQKAWDTLLKYGKQDVELLRSVYKRIRPLISNHPDMLPNDPIPHCPKCGTFNLESRGYACNKTQTFRRYICRDCGGWTQIPVKGQKSIMRAA